LSVMRDRILCNASMSCVEAPNFSRLTSNTPEAVCSTSGRSRPRRFLPKAGRPRPKGCQVLALEVGLSPRPWWLLTLLIASLPCGLGFFHEVGAKLLVEIGPEGDADTTTP
jgi:hypothetical protein